MKKRNAEPEVTMEGEATSWKHGDWKGCFLICLDPTRSGEAMDIKKENSSMKKFLLSAFDSF